MKSARVLRSEQNHLNGLACAIIPVCVVCGSLRVAAVAAGLAAPLGSRGSTTRMKNETSKTVLPVSQTKVVD